MSAVFDQASLPIFSAIDTQKIEPLIQTKLAQNRAQLEKILAQPELTWDSLMNPMEAMNDDLDKAWSPFSHLHSVMESETLRDVYNKILPQLTDYETEISQNEKLYNAITQLYNQKEFSQFNAAQQRIIENDIRDFKLAGVHLLPEEKKQFADLQMKLSKLSTTFAENLLDATHAYILPVKDVKLLEGLPPQALQLAADNAKARNIEGYVFTLEFPSYSTAIKFLRNRDLRKELYVAFTTRASDQGPFAGKWDNTAIMEEIMRARMELAKIVGFDNYAEYSLATKMAKTPEQVLDFLNHLLEKSKPFAEREYAEVTEFARKVDNITNLEAWDVPYYSEKLQQSKFQFTQEDFRPYFPVQKVLEGLFGVVNKLYGLTIKEDKNINVWHKDVHFFSIYDTQQQLRGGFYVDLYARPHKREGAWMDECRSRRQLNRDPLQLPVAFLTCNFMPPVGDQPALLTHDDVITVFHEFGHCLQHLLTEVNYPSVAGINDVPWDAVEFPSQFMENYCWEKDGLSLIATHYQTGAPLPDEIFEKLIAARHFQTGLQMVRQLEFSLFDFQLHLEYDLNKPLNKSNQVQNILDQVRKKTAVVPVPAFNRFQHSFSHVFSGAYAAGYYSYKWAEVLSSDAFSLFEEKGIFDRTTGISFMQNILEVGGVRDPLTSFVAFRGREPTIDALLKQSGLS